MSDGNFNRALLPSTPYASGLKAGRAQGRQWALEAFEAWLSQTMPDLDADARHTHAETFRQLLSHKL